MNLAVHLESNNVLSLRSYFQSRGGGGYFFETPGISVCIKQNLHKILTLQACISGVWWTIFECKVCASKLKTDTFSCRPGEL